MCDAGEYFDLEALQFYFVVLFVASPILLIGGMVVYWIRQTNQSWSRRGFEVKLNAGEKPALEKRHQDDVGRTGD